jgi:hypothetical protein
VELILLKYLRFSGMIGVAAEWNSSLDKLHIMIFENRVLAHDGCDCGNCTCAKNDGACACANACDCA